MIKAGSSAIDRTRGRAAQNGSVRNGILSTMLGRLMRVAQSYFDYARFVYGQESKYAWGALIVVAGFVATALPAPVVDAIGVYTILATIAVLVIDALRIGHKWRSAEFRKRDSPPRFGGEGPWTQWTAPDAFVVTSRRHPAGEETDMWFDHAVNRALRSRPVYGVASTSGHPTPAIRAQLDQQHRYHLPGQLQNRAALALRKTGAAGGRPRLPVRFNGRLLRLCTEPTVEQLAGGELVFQRVSYFDGECSNELWPLHDTKIPLEESPVQPFVVDRNERIRSLENSAAAHIVGISVLAVTKDDQVVFVRQAAGSSVAPRSLAASGSGSLEYRDAKQLTSKKEAGEFDASQLLMNGMLREMREESNVREAEIVRDSAVLTSYFRWMRRGAKPEFTGLVRLSCTIADLSARRVTGGETAFTERVIGIPAEALRQAADAFRECGALTEANERHALVDKAIAPLASALGEAVRSEMPAGRRPQPEPPSSISPSGEAAWLAAAMFLAENPDWIETPDPVLNQSVR
jgi:hypothetical protein